MSSNYQVLCLSHDPALELETEWQVRAYAVDEVTSRRDRALADHTSCDLLLARYSGGLVEVGCPPHGYYHRDVEWVGAGWLRLAVAVAVLPEPPSRGVKRSLDRVIGPCWSRVRLHRLWRVMVGEEFGIEPDPTPAVPDADQCAASTPTDGEPACPVNRHFHRCTHPASDHDRHRCVCRAEFEMARGVVAPPADTPGVGRRWARAAGLAVEALTGLDRPAGVWHPEDLERAARQALGGGTP